MAGTAGPNPAVLYAAKSTEDKHGSIPTQLADCRAAVQGREIVDEIATLVGLSRSRVYELLHEAGER